MGPIVPRFLRAGAILFSIVLLILAATPPGHAQAPRVALVIGNSAYVHTAKLTNPRNDARDFAEALRKVGFLGIDGFDLDKVNFEKRVREFAIALNRAGAGVFFYAGHGLQVSGQNYLVPIDAELTAPSVLEFEMVRLDAIQRIMEREAQTNILFLDACRDNPLARNLSRAMGTRSAEIGRGLAAIESGVGTLISFSTQPGNVALDGTGRNSPFAGALVRRLASGDDLSRMLIAVRNDVMKETQRKQVPWEHSAMTGPFYFKKAAPRSNSESEELAAVRAQLKRLEERLAQANVPAASATKPVQQKSETASPPAAPAQQVAAAPAQPVAPAPPTAQRSAPSDQQLAKWRSDAAPIAAKMQSYSSSSGVGFGRMLSDLSGGKIKLEWQPPGSIVPLLEQLDAVASGRLDAGWSFPGLWAGKAQAAALFGGQIAAGHEPARLVRWMRERGERELNQLYQETLKLKVRALACGVGGPEGIWFKKAITAADDLKAVSIRTAGFSHYVMEKMGMKPAQLAPGEIMGALEQGRITAVEFSTPAADDDLGLPRVVKHFYYPGFHAPAALNELLFNSDRWAALSEAQRALIGEACRRTLEADLAEIEPHAVAGLARLIAKGATVRELPPGVAAAATTARDAVATELSAKDAVFRKVWASYSSFK